MGREVFKCKYNKLSDKKIFITDVASGPEIKDKMSPGPEGAKHLYLATEFAAAPAINNNAIKSKYNGEIYFTKTLKKCKNNDEYVYTATNTLCQSDQGMIGLLGCQTKDIVKSTVNTLKGITNPAVDCEKVTINTCYEQGLRIEPLGGPFDIYVDKTDGTSLSIIDYLKDNPQRHPIDSIPSEYNSRVKIPCESFENIDEYSNYINSIKEFNGPNYIRNIYFTALFIFLFYIFMKLYVKKK